MAPRLQLRVLAQPAQEDPDEIPWSTSVVVLRPASPTDQILRAAALVVCDAYNAMSAEARRRLPAQFAEAIEALETQLWEAQ